MTITEQDIHYFRSILHDIVVWTSIGFIVIMLISVWYKNKISDGINRMRRPKSSHYEYARRQKRQVDLLLRGLLMVWVAMLIPYISLVILNHMAGG